MTAVKSLLPAILLIGMLVGCELQTEIHGTSTIYAQSTWTPIFGMALGLSVTLAGAWGALSSKVPNFVRRYGIALAFIGIIFFVLGISIFGTYVEVHPDYLKGNTGVIWDRYTYDISFDEVSEIHEFEEEEDPDNKDATLATFYRFVFKDEVEILVKKDGYLKYAESEFFENAEAHGVTILVGDEYR